MAMSTGWNAKRHDDARGAVEEILNFGIDNIEAGYSMQPSQLDELAGLLPEGNIKVISIHNFCPIPPDHKCNWGDDFLLSSPNEELRKKGIRSTLQTIAWAQKLKAKIVVMHLGIVEMDRGLYNSIKQAIADGREGEPAFRLAIEEMKEERDRLIKPHFDAVRRTLDDIAARLPKGIVLGLENRYEYSSIPNIREMETLLNEYGGLVGYWHDTGHAFVQETMGFYEKDEYIKTLHHRLIGLHIHDSLKISDHRAPGYGEIDFASLLKPYLKDEIIKVLEFHPRVTPAEAAKGIEFLRMKDII